MASPAVQNLSPNRQITRQAPRRAGTGQDRSVFGEIVHFLGPAGLSLVCHLIFLFLLSLTGWAVGATAGDGLSTEFTAQVVSQGQEGPVGSFHFPGRANQDHPDAREKQGESEASVEDLASLLQSDKSFQMTPVDVGGTGLNAIGVEQIDRGDIVGTGIAVANGGGIGLGGGLGDRDLAGGGPVGAMWGVGRGQQARSVVYVMDRSGSMADTFILLQRELMKAIGTLQDDQQFNLIWFNDSRRADEWSARMRRATEENKAAVFDAIERITAEGQTEPVNAIKKAMGFRPDVIFLLSDGDFSEDNETILRLFKQMNRSGRTIVNTILFNTTGTGEEILRRIAEENRGEFKVVTKNDIVR